MYIYVVVFLVPVTFGGLLLSVLCSLSSPELLPFDLRILLLLPSRFEPVVFLLPFTGPYVECHLCFRLSMAFNDGLRFVVLLVSCLR